MASDKQVQKAGDGAYQIQAGTIIVGIDEKRAREVYTEMSEQTIAQCTSEATATANARIGRFEEELLPRIEKIENDFRSFSDPSFQVLLRKAQLTAACTDREGDYAILAELLTHRVKNKNNTKKKASIQRAVEIVDQIDEDALCGLTNLFVLLSYAPITGNIDEGIDVLDQLHTKLQYGPLPVGTEWIDNLAILGAITINPISKFSNYEDLLSGVLSGYTAVGVQANSEPSSLIQRKFDELNIGYMFVDHSLLEGYKRINLPQTSISTNTQTVRNASIDGEKDSILQTFEADQLDCIRMAFANYSKDGVLMNQVKQRFIQALNSHESIARAISWFNSISNAMTITSVGRVIAHTNAKRIDPDIPDLD